MPTVRLRRTILSALAAIVVSGACFAAVHARAAQAVDVQEALGTWRSTEQFEGESRLSFAFQRKGDGIVGWAILLGQHRKSDDRATLGLTFHTVAWSDSRFRFETMLPEDEGTIGWQLVVTTKGRATLTAVTENGEPISDDLSWTMTR